MVYNKADFKKHIETLQIDGFKLKSAVQAYLFVRKKSDRTETITLSYRNYAPHGFYIDGVSADIYYPQVENILESFKRISFPDKHLGSSTIHKSFVKLQNVDYTKFDIEIHDDESFSEVNTEVNKIIKKGCVPFFEQFKTLGDVWFKTEKMPIDKMANFIVQPLPQRRMVIKRLCNDENYQEYVNMVVNYYKSENDTTWLEIEKLDSFLNTMV